MTALPGIRSLPRTGGPLLAVCAGLLIGCSDSGNTTVAPRELGTVNDLSVVVVSPWRADLSWSDVRGETGYDVHRSTQPDFEPTPATRIAKIRDRNVTGFVDDKAVDSTTYYYKVVARWYSFDATVSNQAMAVTPIPRQDVLVSDEFNRTIAPGWGDADTGGNWEKDDWGPMRVDGFSGLITVSDSVPQDNVLNDPGTYGRYIYGSVRFRIDTAPDQGFHTVNVYARRDDSEPPQGRYYYRFAVFAYADGTMALRVDKEVDGQHMILTETTTIPLTFEPGTWYRLRWAAEGTNPTHLRARVGPAWEVSPPWQLEVEHDDPALDVKGTTGVRIQAAAAQTTFPVIFSFDALTVIGE